jgi:hypothetical protein
MTASVRRRRSKSVLGRQSLNGSVRLNGEATDEATFVLPADLDPLVQELVSFIRKYVVLTDAQVLIVALWVIHTHSLVIDEINAMVQQTPYLAVTSPDKRCGKTRLLETLEQIVMRPWRTITPSEAVLFRQIDRSRPTLLLDETDTIFNPKMRDRYEGHRALLNAGNRKGARVSRCLGSSGEIADFDPSCPKVLAGIGTLPDTVTDRSIPIRLKRKSREEKVARFLLRTVKPEAEAIKASVAEFLDELELEDEPEMPPQIDDRMQEGCELLMALADAADCGRAAREALVELVTGERLDSDELMRHRLLRDIRTVWLRSEKIEERQIRHVPTKTLLGALYRLPESKWTSYYGRNLTDVDLASLLKPYGIEPKVGKVSKNVTKRGYARDQMYDAWERCVPE